MLFQFVHADLRVQINIWKQALWPLHNTEMRFASFLSGGFITAIVVNPPERKLAKRTSVHKDAFILARFGQFGK